MRNEIEIAKINIILSMGLDENREFIIPNDDKSTAILIRAIEELKEEGIICVEERLGSQLAKFNENND